MLLVTCLLLLVPAVLAACGSSDDDDTSGESPTPEANENSSEATWEGPITFGDFAYDSEIVHNRIMQYIVENGWGYETESITATVAPMIQGLNANDVQIVSELYMQNQPDSFFNAIEDGTLVDLGPNYKKSIQGWFVPTYMIEGDAERGIEPMAPELETVKDLEQYADLFEDPANPDKGRFVNGIPAWEATQISSIKLKVYGLADDFTDFQPGSQAAEFASLSNAYREGKPWVGYLWAPTWPFAEMDLTLLEEPPYTEECWNTLTAAIGEGGEVPDQACAFPDTEVHVIANGDFSASIPEDMRTFFKNYSSTLESTSELLLYLSNNEASPEETAIWWLKNNEDTWSKWVPDEVAQKVSDALAEEG